MLVLTRKKHEGITIDHPMGPIHITVERIEGNQVRLGIEAEPTIAVHRDEVAKEIEKEEGYE
jgi:carbon storage regulator